MSRRTSAIVLDLKGRAMQPASREDLAGIAQETTLGDLLNQAATENTLELCRELLATLGKETTLQAVLTACQAGSGGGGGGGATSFLNFAVDTGGMKRQIKQWASTFRVEPVLKVKSITVKAITGTIELYLWPKDNDPTVRLYAGDSYTGLDLDAEKAWLQTYGSGTFLVVLGIA